MCLAVPTQLTEIRGDSGTVELGGVSREISLLLVPEAQVGDYLLVHAGYGIGILDQDEAQQTLDLLNEIASTSPDA